MKPAASTCSKRSHAAAIVAAQAQDMQYLGWFVAIVREYPEYEHDWARAMATARRVQLALHIAESLLRPVPAPALSRCYEPEAA